MTAPKSFKNGDVTFDPERKEFGCFWGTYDYGIPFKHDFVQSVKAVEP